MVSSFHKRRTYRRILTIAVGKRSSQAKQKMFYMAIEISEVLNQTQKGYLTTTEKSSEVYLRSTEANRAFLIKYSPDIKARVAGNPLSAVDVVQNNPTMAQIVSVYGSGLAEDWLLIQLVHSFGMCGFDFILGEDQSIKYTATLS